MPSPQIASLAKRSGKSVQAIEKVWNDVKSGLMKSIPESDPKFYAVLVSTIKKKLGIKKKKVTKKLPK